ncbi:unnamed protein product [Blepharisma stoltei]|uniref:Cytidyltransferase-like domain-containing protein n=1 Tax=Blepharisma stoltei TaxID=1481888 RepID=A0AAU9ITW0_9CILI|nr:unnamed protein product [Blepharisma stoltei]
MNTCRYVISCSKGMLGSINLPNIVVIAENWDLRTLWIAECSRILNDEGFESLIRQPVVGVKIGDWIEIETDERWMQKHRNFSESIEENIQKTWDNPDCCGTFGIEELRTGDCHNLIFYSGKKLRDLEVSNAAILSGSFRPLHHGHINLLKKASEFLHSKHALFELTIQHPDKGIVTEEDLTARLKDFSQPIMITNRSLYVNKSMLFKNSTFIVGYDTIVRILNPIYYSDANSLMIAMGEIKLHGNKFLVAGRVVDEEYRELRVDEVPDVLRGLIIPLPNFREDVSSTEIRNKMLTADK